VYQPSRTAMQSGSQQTRYWRLDFDIQEKWENPLMGWTSSADSVQEIQLKFETVGDAVDFATSQGWNVRIDAPHVAQFKKKTYADNFIYSKDPLRLIRTK